MTLQMYCMLCVVAWAIFALYFFRKDLFKRQAENTTVEDGKSATPAVNDIIGHSQTVVNPNSVSNNVSPRSHVKKPVQTTDEEEVLDVEYEYDDLESLRTQADSVPPVELKAVGVDLETINDQLAAMQVQTDEEMQEMQAAAESQTGMRQLELTFDTVVTPYRSLEADQAAGATLKEISRTDMFYQAFQIAGPRVDEILNSVKCKVVHLDGDELDVAAKEEDEETAPQNTDEDESDDEGEAAQGDFISGFLDS